jgi:uncharacterized membrane protein YoaK (UPF0700 family)
MGVQSASVHLLLGGYGSTNVMTTNTTQLSIDAAELVLARRRERHNPPGEAATDSYAAARGRLTRLAPIMLGFLIGTIVGGLAYASAGLICLGAAIGIVVVLAVWMARRP